GPAVDDREWDVKVYFALNAAVHEAACAAWSLKRYYDGWRPITAIRYMGGLGQSSSPASPSYNTNGLPLVTNLIELVTTATAAAGSRHYPSAQLSLAAPTTPPGRRRGDHRAAPAHSGPARALRAPRPPAGGWLRGGPRGLRGGVGGMGFGKGRPGGGGAVPC